MTAISLIASSAVPPVVEIEEQVYSYQPANNGAGPMWCHGSTCLVRTGNKVFATGLQTIPGVRPLNNCRGMLFRRDAEGWRQVWVESGRTREPCPLVGFDDGRLLVSVNPTLATNLDSYSGPARPQIFEFSAADADQLMRTLVPQWSGQPPFTEHSYRSLAADGSRGEVILFQNVGYTHAEWAFLDRDGKWSAQGQLRWPWGADYPKPQPIRLCYPNVAVRDRAVHFCGVSDIVEPNPEWRAFKRKLTGREWDYDFRRLFYTWSRDIRTGQFQPWVEIASREKTCGWISPGDLWVAPDGTVHILWTERALDERLREKFFPEEKQSYSLNYAVLREGKILSRRTLMVADDGGSKEQPGRARFHITPANRLFVIVYVSGTDAQGQAISENRVLEIAADGAIASSARIPFEKPFVDFFTATVRGGSPASKTVELLGTRQGESGVIRYSRVRLVP